MLQKRLNKFINTYSVQLNCFLVVIKIAVFILVIGSSGAYENDAITTTQFISRVGTGLGLLFLLP